MGFSQMELVLCKTIFEPGVRFIFEDGGKTLLLLCLPFISKKNIQLNPQYLVEAVVLAGAEDLLDVGVRWGWEGRGGGSVRGPELITGVVTVVQLARPALRPRQGARLGHQGAGLQLLDQLLLVLPGDLLRPSEVLHHADALLQHLPPPLLLLAHRLPPLPHCQAGVSLEEVSQRVLQQPVAGLSSPDGLSC